MEISTNIFVDGLELVNSKRILLPKNSTVLLKLAHNFELEFRFNKTESSKEPKTETEVIDNRLIFILKDYTNQLGTGYIKPIHIGQLNSKKLYLSYYLYALNEVEDTRIIDINLFFGETIENE